MQQCVSLLRPSGGTAVTSMTVTLKKMFLIPLSTTAEVSNSKSSGLWQAVAYLLSRETSPWYQVIGHWLNRGSWRYDPFCENSHLGKRSKRNLHDQLKKMSK